MSSSLNTSVTKRWVVKVGSSLITSVQSGINIDRIESWAAQIAKLKSDGLEIVLVSSGSVVEGMKRLGWTARPHEVHRLQVAAAVGQMGLVRTYETAFAAHGYQTAQVLLTNADISNRARYLNARNTLRTLLELGIIPVVNENDTVSTDDINFGDNDNLAGLVTNIVDAELLVILTDQKGLYDAHPSQASAKLLSVAQLEDEQLDSYAGPSSQHGRGGMIAKLEAARKAARSGAATVIASGLVDNQLRKIFANAYEGTLLVSKTGRIAAHKQWLAGRSKETGRLHLDSGAVQALLRDGRSLLPVGVRAVEGKFKRGDMVVCLNQEAKQIAKGLINYDFEEAERIKGCRTGRIESILGYVRDPELIHRDNMVVIQAGPKK